MQLLKGQERERYSADCSACVRAPQGGRAVEGRGRQRSGIAAPRFASKFWLASFIDARPGP
jgi:hypothetical protein